MSGTLQGGETTSAQRVAHSLLVLKNTAFSVAIDQTNGSIAQIVHPADPAGMNWVTSAFDTPWQSRSLQWGLGFANVGPAALHRGRWEVPELLESDSEGMRTVYVVDGLKIEVTRRLESDSFVERYVFTNTGVVPMPLTHWSPGAFALYAPFNDNTTTAEDCLEHRAHAHLWCGGSTAWVCALRMGGRAPHLGLVVTEGALKEYSVAGRDLATSSNTRGVFLLHPDIRELAPGASYALGWTLFWHEGWDDFFAQCARRSAQFVRLGASRYTVTTGDMVEISATSGTNLNDARLEIGGQLVPLKGEGTSRQTTIRPSVSGELTCSLTAPGGIDTRLQLNVVPPLDELVAARVRFIVNRQQVNTPGDALEGAFLVYDNERDALVRGEGANYNEGRERIGMGVLLARWLRQQSKRDERLMQALQRYYAFVRKNLQREDGTVLNGASDEERRLYNWPWVMQLHLEMAQLTGDRVPLRRFVRTVEKFYDEGGAEMYPIGLPIFEGLRALNAAGWKNDHDHLRAYFIQHGEKIAARGLRYPPQEVNFEQSIVAPAAIVLLELYQATGESRWLAAARPHLRCLELFNGRQPDHRLHDVAIRHWDGYWFGKSRMWGDTFPHYWSTLTALAFHQYGAAAQEQSYTERAKDIVRGTLSLFTPGGRASAAFIYPRTVNGRSAHFADAYANDQDWALVHALAIFQP